MASLAQTCKGIVVRKTKLGDSDQIVTLFCEDGSKLQLVAKGARKPKSSFSSRLDLLCESELLYAPTRSLGIAKEVRLLNAHMPAKSSYELSLYAAVVMEFLSKAAMEDLKAPRLYAMAHKLLGMLDDAHPHEAGSLCAAFLLKGFSLLGFRPQLSHCVSCGAPVRALQSVLRISYAEGGVLCADCACNASYALIDAECAAILDALIARPFEECLRISMPASVATEAWAFIKRWSEEHLSVRLRSIEYLEGEGLG
jgi:DNA repair protein RecO (recombination protein O)